MRDTAYSPDEGTPDSARADAGAASRPHEEDAATEIPEEDSADAHAMFNPEAPQPILVPMARPVQMDAGEIPSLPDASILSDEDTVSAPPISRWVALGQLLLLLPIGFLGAVAAAPLNAWWSPADERWEHVLSTITAGTTLLLVCLLLTTFSGQRPAHLGLTGRRVATDTALGLVSFVTTYAALSVLIFVIVLLFPQVLSQQSRAAEAIEETFPPMSLPQVTLLMAFVAFWEEVVFRGFLLTRLKRIVGHWWLAVPVAAAFFGIGHVYQGPLAVAMIVGLGLVLGTLFVWRRSLVPAIVFHFVNNVFMFLILRSYG